MCFHAFRMPAYDWTWHQPDLFSGQLKHSALTRQKELPWRRCESLQANWHRICCTSLNDLHVAALVCNLHDARYRLNEEGDTSWVCGKFPPITIFEEFRDFNVVDQQRCFYDSVCLRVTGLYIEFSKNLPPFMSRNLDWWTIPSTIPSREAQKSK